MPTLLGLKSCDTCRKAQKALEAVGFEVTFRDVRTDPLTDAELSKYLELFGDTLVNTRSTTWRGLGENERSAPTFDLLKEHPALMKRPVIESPKGATLGWSNDAQVHHLG